MRRLVLSIILMALGLSLMAQQVTITGRVNRPEALVRLMVYDDLLNMHETPVAETTADAQGFFILEGQVKKTMPAGIFVGLESVDMVIVPGASYEVSIVVPEPDPNASYFERESPTLRVKTATDKGVYRQIVLSQAIIDDYVLSYVDELFRRRQYRYLDSIRATIDEELHVTDQYVLQYNTYRIAAIQMAMNADGGKKVIGQYYDGQPVLYDCQSYMDLFKDLFKTFTLTDEFASRNPELADLVNIYQLRNLYYEDYQSRQWVRGQLRSISKQSKSMATKALVSHTMERFDRFAQGAEAPDFELQTAEGTSVKLSDYKNSMVLLQFVDGSSYTVDHQFETLAELHHHWQDSVQLITVSTKDQLASHRKRFEEHHYDWPLLNLGNDILLLERYEVRTFPEYFIILPDTKIGLAPAPNPERTLGEKVTQLLKK
jgi:peroxiredoxin